MRLLTAIFSRFKPIWEHYSHANVFLHMFPILQQRYLHVQNNSCYRNQAPRYKLTPRSQAKLCLWHRTYSYLRGTYTGTKNIKFLKKLVAYCKVSFFTPRFKIFELQIPIYQQIKDIIKNTHINPSVSLEKKSRDTVPLSIKKNTTQNRIWIFQNKVFSDGHIKNKTIKNVMSWHLFRKNQQ